jgi:excisionase family DNA binding protein
MAKGIYIIPEKEYRDNYERSIREIVREELSSVRITREVSPINETYLTRKEVAKRLLISLPTFDDYVKRKVIQAYKVGSRIRVKESDVEKALKAIKTSL